MADTTEIIVLGSHVPTLTVGTVAAEVDEETILLSPSDFSYYGLQGSGDPVWSLIDGKRSVDQIIAQLQADHADTDPERIRTDSLEFIEALAAAGLIELR